MKIINKLFLFSIVLLLTFVLNSSLSAETDGEQSLPELRSYPLPEALANYRSTSSESDNYFDVIKPHELGAFIWTEFPIEIYVETPAGDLSPSALNEFQQWQKAVFEGIELWRPYLQMTIVEEESDNTDIFIYRRQPELKAKLNPETGLYDIPRVKAATAKINFFLTDTTPQQLKHQMTIEVNPRQTYDYLVTNIAHELGHALGIWGHSENPKDVMYFAHTQDIPPLSDRDLNTLKILYQQPTRLGGFLSAK